MSSIKRPLDEGSDSPSKKVKSEVTSTSGLSAADLIARKRAEVAAKIANFSAQRGVSLPTVGGQASGGKSTISAVPSLPARPQAGPPTNSTNGSAKTSSVPAGIDPDLMKKIAEAKRRANASRANIEISSNPYLAAAALAAPKKPGSSATPPIAPQGSGLKMAAHPLLLETAPAPAASTSKKDRFKPMLPKFTSIKANARNAASPTPPPPSASPFAAPDVKANPYTSLTPTPPSSGASPSPALPENAPKDRSSRSFRFNQKGKYTALGEQMRKEAQLEALKQRIAESAKKAGLDSEFETFERTIRREPPPTVEWWDESLLPNKTYDDIKPSGDGTIDFSNTTIHVEASPITLYIQHPIPIPSPWDKNQVELKGVKLTKKEMKKMRRQRRMAELQDKQDRQKMGLIPPDPPKVRLANLMKVLTSDAVQDPTRVEAKVRREVAMRRKAHDDMNRERQLTDEQRREKVETKKAEEEKKGIYAAVYKVKNLTDPSHRFKVRKNAEQYGLTGVCIFNPNFNLVLVEGSSAALQKYERLMLNRIKWTEAAAPRADGDGGEEDGEGAVASTSQHVKQEDENHGFGDQSLDDNCCYQVWKGPVRDRTFTSFKPKKCPNDSLAKEFLGEKLASYWDAAKAYAPEEAF